MLCLHNLDAKPVELRLDTGVPKPSGAVLVDLLTGARSDAGADGSHTLMVDGYGYHWFRVGGLDALMRRHTT